MSVAAERVDVDESILRERIAKPPISLGIDRAETGEEARGREPSRAVTDRQALNTEHHTPSGAADAELASFRPADHRKNQPAGRFQAV